MSTVEMVAIKETEEELKARGVRDVKLALGPGAVGMGRDELYRHVNGFLQAYLQNRLRQIEKLEDEFTFPGFELGKTYLTLEGKPVKIVQESKNYGASYATVKGSDGVWRYNRTSDMGRCTASPFDNSCAYNLVPMEVPKHYCPSCYGPTHKIMIAGIPVRECINDKPLEMGVRGKYCGALSGFWKKTLRYLPNVWTFDHVPYSGSYWSALKTYLMQKLKKAF